MTKGVKTGGRKKGTPNKVTATTRDSLAKFLHHYEDSKLAKDFDSLEPKDRIVLFEKLLSYVMPKVSSADEVEGVCYTKEDVRDSFNGGEVRNWKQNEVIRQSEERRRNWKIEFASTTWCFDNCAECIIGKECWQRKEHNKVVAVKDCWLNGGEGCAACEHQSECKHYKEFGDIAILGGWNKEDDDDESPSQEALNDVSLKDSIKLLNHIY